MEDLKLELQFLWSYSRLVLRAVLIIMLGLGVIPFLAIFVVSEWIIDFHWDLRRKLKDAAVFKVVMHPIEAKRAFFKNIIKEVK